MSEYRGENERAERTEGFIFVVRVKRRDKTMHHRGGIQGHQQESYRFAEYPSAFSSNECHGHIISTIIRPYVPILPEFRPVSISGSGGGWRFSGGMQSSCSAGVSLHSRPLVDVVDMVDTVDGPRATLP